MQLSDISIPGIVLVVALVSGAVSLYGFISRSMMSRIIRAGIYMLVSLSVVGIIAWGLCWIGRWWADLFWALFMTIAVSVLVVGKIRQPLHPYLLIIVASVVAGLAVSTGTLLLCFHSISSSALVFAVIAFTSGQLFRVLSVAMQACLGSLRHTQEHYLYLKANGATHQEALMPTFRHSLCAAVLPSLTSWAQPLLVAPPALACGLLLAGVQPMLALLTTALAMLSAFVGSVLAAIVMLWLVSRMLFDKQGMFKYQNAKH